MIKEEYALIYRCRKEMLEIDEKFYGQERIGMQEKEENFYKSRFKAININPKIVSKIYSCRNNDKEIQNIKDNPESLVI